MSRSPAHTAVEIVSTPEVVARPWYAFGKRVFDLFFAVVGLVVLTPVGLLIAVLVKLDDGGPVFYRQVRVGQWGRLFGLLKFRTMRVDAEQTGPSVTKDRDPRITRVGRWLRRGKLDELPQLWNVLKGEMSFVGPRPEVPRYVERYTPEQRQLLQFKPGITDLATLVFRDEESLLRNASDVESFYVQHCIPRKFRLNMQYAKRANVLEDTLIILETLTPYWLSVLCTYLLTLGFSLWLSYQLRYEFTVPVAAAEEMRRFALLIVPLQTVLLVWRRQLVGLLSYFDEAEMRQLGAGLGIAALVQLAIWWASGGQAMPPRSIIVMDFIVAFFLIGGIRLTLRMLRETRGKPAGGAENQTTSILRLGVVGTGEVATWIAQQINRRGDGRRRVEVFFDDDPDKWHKVLHEIPVAGMPEMILDGSWASRLDEVIVATPEASPERLRQIRDILGSACVRMRKVLSVDDILSD